MPGHLLLIECNGAIGLRDFRTVGRCEDTVTTWEVLPWGGLAHSSRQVATSRNPPDALACHGKDMNPMD